MTSARILFQLTGSIAAFKACQAISRLVQDGFEVQTVASAAALRFVGPATLEGLTARPVATEVFADGAHMDHINLIRWADVAVLCPASANTINKLASGLGDDLISTLFLAHRFDKPYLVVPAMNTAMFQHPATQRSLRQLREWGLEVLGTGAGALACGEVGEGRLLEPDAIVAAIRAAVAVPAAPRVAPPPDPSSGSGDGRLDVVVTSGGTIVPIDGVRSIGNTSSGATGATIATVLAAHGHRVTLIHAAGAELPSPAAEGPSPDAEGNVSLVPYTTVSDLAAALEHELGRGTADAVIHLAAVSDYVVEALEVDGERRAPDAATKLPSGHDVTVHLKPTPKLLHRLREQAGAPIVVVGFKLTNGADEPARREAVATIVPFADLVVHNDLSEIDRDRHPATLYRGSEVVARVSSKRELAEALERAIVELASPLTASGDRT